MILKIDLDRFAKMGRKCFVPYCKSGYNTCHEIVAMFSCPNDPESIEKWSEAIARQDRPLRATDCICEKHFKEEDIVRNWRAFDQNGKEIMKVAYKRKRLRDGAVPCFFPSDKNTYSRKRRKSDTESDEKIRKILAQTAQSYSENLVVYPDTVDDYSDNLDGYSDILKDKSDSNENGTGVVEVHCNEFNLNDNSENQEESEDEVKYIDILNKSKLFDDIWQDAQIISLPSKSWAVFLLQPNEERKIVFTQMGFSNTGAPVPVKQVCLDSEMRVELYLKNTKLNFEEMNIKPPKMFTADDVSSFIKSVDGLVDWE